LFSAVGSVKGFDRIKREQGTFFLPEAPRLVQESNLLRNT